MPGAGRYEEAVAAYEAAGAIAEAARVLLQHLRDGQGAAALVARSGDAEAAALLAQHCTALGEHAVRPLPQTAAMDSLTCCLLVHISCCCPWCTTANINAMLLAHSAVFPQCLRLESNIVAVSSS